MTAPNDGGPAFPQTAMPLPQGGGWDWPDQGWGYGGMRLRDYLASRCPSPRDWRDSDEQDARLRYRWADAMLKVRDEDHDTTSGKEAKR